MCLEKKGIKGIVADKDIPCIKLLLKDNLYYTIFRATPVKLGKLMVGIGDTFIDSYTCEIPQFHTCYDFDVAVRAYIPKGSTYYIDEDNPYEVFSSSLFVTDEILFTYSEYKNHSINSTQMSTDIDTVSSTDFIKEGKYFICVKDVEEMNGTISYKRGCLYLCEEEGYITDEQGNEYHWWYEVDDETFSSYFYLVDDIRESVLFLHSLIEIESESLSLLTLSGYQLFLHNVSNTVSKLLHLSHSFHVPSN